MHCNNCQPNNPCGSTCKVDSSDVCYTGIDLTCIDVFPNSRTLENYLIKIDEVICQILSNSSLSDYGILTLNVNGNQIGAFQALGAVDTLFNLNMVNVGAGAEVFKTFDTVNNEYELRTIEKTGDLITVTQNPDDISLSIDETELANFVQSSQLTYSIDNVGTGEEIYVAPNDITGNNVEFNLKSVQMVDGEDTGTSLLSGDSNDPENVFLGIKTLDTETLTFDLSTPGKLKIDIPTTASVSDFYINQETPVSYADWLKANKEDNGGIAVPGYSYVGRGTLAKPYTNTHVFTLGNELAPPAITANSAVQNALDAYVGVTNDPLNPEFYGRRLKLQATSNAHVFTGNLNYHGLKFNVQTGAVLYNTPLSLSGENSWLVNLDHSNFNDSDIIFVTLEVETDGVVITRNNGFKNKGTDVITNNFVISKSISIINKGNIYNDRSVEAGDTPGDFLMFDLNAATTTGFKNDGNALISCIGGRIGSTINPIIKGGIHTSDFSDVLFNHGLINYDIDPNIYPFEIYEGGYFRMERCGFYLFGDLGPSKSLFFMEGEGTILLISPLVNGIAESLAEINVHLSNPDLDPVFTMYNGVNKDGFTCTDTLFKVNFTGGRTDRWRRVYFNNNYMAKAEVDDITVDMTAGNTIGVVNFLGRASDFSKEVMAFYPRFGSRAAAIAATMPIGSMFINTNGLPISPSDPSFKLDIVI